MTLLVFTPTYRPGGLDVLEASLMRQTYKDFHWVVSDQRFLNRYPIWGEIESRVDFPIYWVQRAVEPGNKRNLATMYNIAAEHVVEYQYDLLVSLQDYIYLPEDGLQKFVSLYEKYPNDLLTGVTHISRDPYPNKVVDLEGDYTIFAEPYTDKPKRIAWEDVRVSEMYTGTEDITSVESVHWEANWAAVPFNVLHQGIRWDTEYDKGIAYENMDFAKQAAFQLKTRVLMDKTNVAISLPHKYYFEGEREEIKEFSNRDYFNVKWPS